MKLFVLLTCTFIAFTVIGTLTHEAGHYLVAKAFGYESSIHYAYVPYAPEIDEIEERSQREWTEFAFTLGGPLETILTGCIGLFLVRRSTRRAPIINAPTRSQWLFIFLSLFWLRESANFVVILAQELTTGSASVAGDEAKISMHLGLPVQVIGTVAGCLGFAILAYVLIQYIPSTVRLQFMAAGIVGGVIGYYLWIIRYGPIIMP